MEPLPIYIPNESELRGGGKEVWARRLPASNWEGKLGAWKKMQIEYYLIVEWFKVTFLFLSTHWLNWPAAIFVFLSKFSTSLLIFKDNVFSIILCVSLRDIYWILFLARCLWHPFPLQSGSSLTPGLLLPPSLPSAHFERTKEEKLDKREKKRYARKTQMFL